MSDSYVGFDKEVPLEFEIMPEAERTIEEYSQEDKDAIKAPSFLQAAMASQIEEDSSEEEE